MPKHPTAARKKLDAPLYFPLPPDPPASRRGFASMSARQRSAIASLGGKAVARDRDHMAAIGAKGGAVGRGGRPRKGAR